MTPSAIREIFLGLQIPEESLEAEYVRGVATALGDDPLPNDEFLAIGLLLFIQAYDYEVLGFSSVTHPISGSVKFDAMVVAAMFPHLACSSHRLEVRRTWLSNYAKKEVMAYWRSRFEAAGARLLF